MSARPVDFGAELASGSRDPIRLEGSSALARLRERAASMGWRLHELDGSRMADKASMMEELARGLGLPGYFGRNWDALEECLTDPGVMGQDGGRLVVWLHAEAAGRRLPAECKTLREVLAAAGRYWRGQEPPRPFKTALSP